VSLDLAAIRRELHQVPELAFQEFATRQLILDYLSQMEGITIHKFQASNALLVEYTRGSGPYKLFRADMDALPVTETTGCAFSSQNPGLMHACGHDVHMAVLLGTIEKVCRDKPERNLLYLFQPAEEGQGGAESVIAEGIIKKFPVEAAYALHVASGLPVGVISSRPGVFFGIPQEFDVTFRGVASHAAFPEKGVNALSAALEFLTLIRLDIEDLARLEKVIFHVGKMAAGTVRNVVPDTCKLEGTQRSLSKPVKDRINELIGVNSAKAAASIGAQAEVQLLGTYDPVVNASELVTRLQDVCKTAGYTFQEAEIALTGEDFGFFTTLYPGLLFWLGSGCSQPLHSGQFLPDEACIPVGVDIFSRLALS
jgi:N-acetyldiaminopimelate deacetylase